jgi:hypothetical protein
VRPEIDRTRTPKTPITEDQEEPTIAAAPRFGLKGKEAISVLRQSLAAVSAWRKTGRQLRLPAGTLNTYASAFEHPLREEAQKFC